MAKPKAGGAYAVYWMSSTPRGGPEGRHSDILKVFCGIVAELIENRLFRTFRAKNFRHVCTRKCSCAGFVIQISGVFAVLAGGDGVHKLLLGGVVVDTGGDSGLAAEDMSFPIPRFVDPSGDEAVGASHEARHVVDLVFFGGELLVQVIDIKHITETSHVSQPSRE